MYVFLLFHKNMESNKLPKKEAMFLAHGGGIGGSEIGTALLVFIFSVAVTYNNTASIRSQLAHLRS
jgi:hypothetical protein